MGLSSGLHQWTVALTLRLYLRLYSYTPHPSEWYCCELLSKTAKRFYSLEGSRNFHLLNKVPENKYAAWWSI